MHQAALAVSQMGNQHPFAPGEPVGPFDGYSRTPRGFDYTTSYNVATRPRTHERVSFDALRGLIEAYDVAEICLWHRIDSIRSLDWKLIAAEGYAGDITGAIPVGMAALAKPDRISSFSTWMAKWLYDVLAFDAGTLYRLRNRAGRVVGLAPVDGTTIAPLLDYWGNSPQEPAEAYVQYVNGVPWNWLTRSDLIYEPFRPRPNSPYGHAPLESIMLNANTDIRFQIYFLQRFTEGNIPEAFASAPENWNPEQIEVFQTYWDDMIYGDQKAKHQIKWLPGGSQFTWSNEKDFTDTFSLFLMRKTAAAFHVVPADLGFTENVNRSSGESQADVQHRVGDLPLISHIETILTRFLADDLGLPLQIRFDRGEEQDDQLNVAQSDQIYIQNGVVGASEIREMRFGLAEPEGQAVPRVFFTERGGPIPLAALYGVAGKIDPQTSAPDPDSPLPHMAFTGVPGVLPNPPLVTEPLAEQEYGPKALPPAGPVQPGTVAKEDGGAPTTGITSGTGITSYDLDGRNDDEDEPEQVAKELAAFRRFEKARRNTGKWRDFEFEHVPAGDARRLNDQGKRSVAKSTSGYSLNPRSGMISLDVPDGLITPLPGGVDDFHITVVYLGSDVDDVALAQALSAAQDAAAAQPGPLQGTLAGVETFPASDGSDGKVPAYVPVILPGGDGLRAALEGLSASERPGWVPHVTLAYLDEGDALPDPVPPTPVTFTHLSVHRGDVVQRFPLGAVDVAKAGGGDGPKWPGWRLADTAAAYWAPLVLAAVAGTLTPALLSRAAAAYLAAFPDQDGSTPGKQDRNDAAYAWLTAWLASAGITLDLGTLAGGILADGYLIGTVSAAAVVNGTRADTGTWTPGDTAAATAGVTALGGGAALGAMPAEQAGAAVLTGGFIYALARALAGATGDKAALAADLVQVTADGDLAANATLDQLYSAAGASALDWYQGRYTGDYAWVTDPTLQNCAICLGNEAGDPRPLGEPWPSGDTDVYVHFKCGCALVPA
jgi:2'-5' RNA ligase